MTPLLLLFGALGLWFICHRSRYSVHRCVLNQYVRARYSVGWQEFLPTQFGEDSSTQRFWQGLKVELAYTEVQELKHLIESCGALGIQPPPWFEQLWVQRQAEELGYSLVPVRI